MALDEDSQKYLEEAKKGKSRKFAILCKGVTIVGMKVYKIGTEAKYKKELKKEGTGKFYYGVITGKGQNLVFQLPKDEFDKPPTKEVTLKAFLGDEADMKFKPTYELVAGLEGEEEPGTENTEAKEKEAGKSKKKGAPKKKVAGTNSSAGGTTTSTQT
jgi:hypothetical protein